MGKDQQLSTRHWSSEELIIEKSLTLFQKILLCTDGTVTDLLNLYTNAPIRARKLSQHFDSGSGGRILYRQVVLESAAGESYVFAESEFMFDRFSSTLQRDLVETETPIGTLWQRERTEMYREITERSCCIDACIAAVLQVSENTPILRRTYRIHSDGAYIGKITENFAATKLQ